MTDERRPVRRGLPRPGEGSAPESTPDAAVVAEDVAAAAEDAARTGTRTASIRIAGRTT